MSVLALGAGVVSVQAQSIVDVRLSLAEARVNEEVVVSVDLKPAGSAVWCGLRVEWGDGQTRDLRIGSNGPADLALRMPMRYAVPGTYVIRVAGQSLTRGLRSSSACEGGARSVVLRVSGLEAGTPLPAPALASAQSPPPALAHQQSQPAAVQPAAVAVTPPPPPPAGGSELDRVAEQRRERLAVLAVPRVADPPLVQLPATPPGTGAPVYPGSSSSGVAEGDSSSPTPNPSAVSSSPSPSQYPSPGYPSAPSDVRSPSAPSSASPPAILPPGYPSSGPASGSSSYPSIAAPTDAPGAPGSGVSAGPPPVPGAIDCGPNPTPECAGRALAQALRDLRTTLRGGSSGRSNRPPSTPSSPAPPGSVATAPASGSAAPSAPAYPGSTANSAPSSGSSPATSTPAGYPSYPGASTPPSPAGYPSASPPSPYPATSGPSSYPSPHSGSPPSGASPGVALPGGASVASSSAPASGGMVTLPEFPPARGAQSPAGGLVPLPSFPPAAAPQVDRPAAAGPATAPAAAPNPGCTPGPPMEPRDYAQAEYIGRPEGRVARMCFFRSDGRSATESLNFFANGHVVMSSSNAATGPGGGVSVLGTMRGTYGFQEGRLATRMAYAGMGVSQSARSSGSERSLDASGQQRLEQAKVLPNCQRVFLRDAVHALELPPSPAHPPFLVIDGVRWEQMRIDCPAWQGWR